MRIIRAADCRRMPWKNGGGETVEIAIAPEGAGLGDFDWRLSMARVEGDGPFSLFTGVDRTLAILEGEGIFLDVEGRIPFGLTRHSDPLSFPADVPTRAALIAGPITDLNMMTRRCKVVHSMRRLTVNGTFDVASTARELLLFCRSGSVRMEAAGNLILGPHDTLHMRAVPATLPLRASRPAELFLVEIMAAAATE
ncbi:HutD/Ves family protein [Allomesorhizobium camelthorni]|uniref:HutD family protein n=1 Tax=Allomesorhizobium camelthorni TaxID=475069 RepID=A0A6G4WGF1_9HYPH|nr:HutD family protein [Mesorhizobium camelthorni]NGO53273.1 HutD family protein [Mesorhizobium camelthorni]